ncbi:respiratory chain complex I subunit 1 family protein [Sedimenticola thiotaurini]|uniref:Formate hydrogenlyase n=1 Tax=Sedimenticola thiotaurini TaxID=1543721 RepID=A0A0F7K1X5_9GAMM|nr:NADH-quinone oxidoreductase subunit H [Sedimenticola thiotaurini]AKH21559.1 formate hydrogenlyase [Sedimenticola thiotaurini]
MVDFLNPADWLFVWLQTALFVLLAPLFTGWIKWLKCHLQNRRPPSLLQPYRDLLRLTSKTVLLADNASPLFRGAPYIVCGCMVLAASVVPLLILNQPINAMADAIVLVGLFALARFFMALAGMDVGTTFGGMGSSREMTISALAEPAMLMVVFTLSMVASSTNLSTLIEYNLNQELVLRPSMLFALIALVMVGIAENARIPIDNPATHLELTMIHEAMILEYSGRHLALMELAAQLKLVIYSVLIMDLFFPWGIATEASFASLGIALVALAIKLPILGALLAVGETAVAKMRLFRVPTFLAMSFSLAMIGMLSFIILESAK